MQKIMMAFLAFVLAGFVWADSTASFTYQASLKNDKGEPITDEGGQVVRDFEVNIRLWDAPKNGACLWGRHFNIMTDADGLFNVEVADDGGTKIPQETPAYDSLAQVFLDKQAGEIFVGLEVDGSIGEITPRQCLFGVPFASVANDVRKISHDIVVDGNIQMGSKSMTITADGIKQDDGTSEFHDLTVGGEITAMGEITAKGGIDVQGGELKHAGEEVISVPIRGIILWTSPTLPDADHWAICNGETKNGITTPDLRNRFIVGAGDAYAAGATGGENYHTLSIDEMPSHNHTTTLHKHDVLASWKDANNLYTVSEGSSANLTSSSAGSNQAHENRPPYYALYYIMRVK